MQVLHRTADYLATHAKVTLLGLSLTPPAIAQPRRRPGNRVKHDQIDQS